MARRWSMSSCGPAVFRFRIWSIHRLRRIRNIHAESWSRARSAQHWPAPARRPPAPGRPHRRGTGTERCETAEIGEERDELVCERIRFGHVKASRSQELGESIEAHPVLDRYVSWPDRPSRQAQLTGAKSKRPLFAFSSADAGSHLRNKRHTRTRMH